MGVGVGVGFGGIGWATVSVITVPTSTLSPARVWARTVFSGWSLSWNVVSVRSRASARMFLASDQSLSTTSGTSTLPLETSRTTDEPSATVLCAAGDVRTTSPLSTSGSSTVLVSRTVSPWLRSASRAAASLKFAQVGQLDLPRPGGHHDGHLGVGRPALAGRRVLVEDGVLGRVVGAGRHDRGEPGLP